MRDKIVVVLVGVVLGLLLGWNLVQSRQLQDLKSQLAGAARQYDHDLAEKDIAFLKDQVRKLRDRQAVDNGLANNVADLEMGLQDILDMNNSKDRDVYNSELQIDIYNLELDIEQLFDMHRYQEIQILQVLGKLSGGVVIDASDCIELNDIWVSDKEMTYWVELHPITPDLTVRIQHPYGGHGASRILYAYPADEVSPGSVVRLFCGGKVVLGTPEVYLAKETGYGYTVYDLSEYSSAIKLAANNN